MFFSLAQEILKSKRTVVLFQTGTVTRELLARAIRAKRSMDLDLCVDDGGNAYLGHLKQCHNKTHEPFLQVDGPVGTRGRARRRTKFLWSLTLTSASIAWLGHFSSSNQTSVPRHQRVRSAGAHRSGRFVGHAVHPNARRKDWRFKISELDDAMSRPTPVTENSYNAKRQPGTWKRSWGRRGQLFLYPATTLPWNTLSPGRVSSKMVQKMRSWNPGGKS